MNKNNVKLAIQKKGRLTQATMQFLQAVGVDFERMPEELFSSCSNFPLDILYLRDDDIPKYVASGAIDLGIVGKNILYEKRVKVQEVCSLPYGKCTLVLAVPENTKIQSLNDLQNKTVATAYPMSVRKFFRKNNLSVNIVRINGSAELAPTLGIADAIADISATGKTLTQYNLTTIRDIFTSEAVLIKNNFVIPKKKLIQELINRFKNVQIQTI